MKTTLHFLAAFMLFAFSIKSFAQTTDVPRIISYQGQITSIDGSALNGNHRIITHLYGDRFAHNEIWQGTYDVEITSGIFSVKLGSDAYKLPDNTTLDRPLWIGISVDGTPMQPLTQL